MHSHYSGRCSVPMEGGKVAETTNVMVNLLAPGNANLSVCLTLLPFRLITATHRCFFEGRLGPNTGTMQVEALARLFPKMASLMSDIFVQDSVRYEVTDVKAAPGVLRHDFGIKWNV